MPDLSFRPLPITLEEITPAWLTHALRGYAAGIEVRGCEVTDIKRNTCTKIWLRLELNEAGKRAHVPQTVVLKGGFEPHSRKMHYMHESEVRAYRDLYPHLPLRIPTCYFADYDAERRQGIVILEDLRARGVSFCSALEPQSHEMVARRLTDLARYHAASWNSPDFRPGGRWEWVHDPTNPPSKHFEQYLQPEVWHGYIRSARGAAGSVQFHDLAWMRRALDRIAVFSSRLPPCVNHGDTHLGNLYVEADGTPGFFDSLAGRAPAMLEITYHMVCALDTGDRRRWEGALVQHYLDTLVQCGVQAPSFDEAMHQFGVFLAFAYCIFIINESIFQTEAVNTAYTARISAAMIDHRTKDLINAIR
jgi:hypothetical protein